MGYIRQPMVLIPGQVSVPMLKEVNQAAERHQFVNGFFVSRRSKDDKTFLHDAVLRFPDPGAAVAAAQRKALASLRSSSGPGYIDAWACNRVS